LNRQKGLSTSQYSFILFQDYSFFYHKKQAASKSKSFFLFLTVFIIQVMTLKVALFNILDDYFLKILNHSKKGFFEQLNYSQKSKKE